MPRNCAHFCPQSLLISLNLCYVSSRSLVSLRNSIPMLPIYRFWRASLHFRANIQGNFLRGFLPQCLLITLNSEQTFGESTTNCQLCGKLAEGSDKSGPMVGFWAASVRTRSISFASYRFGSGSFKARSRNLPCIFCLKNDVYSTKEAKNWKSCRTFGPSFFGWIFGQEALSPVFAS